MNVSEQKCFRTSPAVDFNLLNELKLDFIISVKRNEKKLMLAIK